MKLERLLIIIFLFFPPLLEADHVILKNGDRITGTIVSTDEKTLTLKTAAMGDVKIDRSAIAGFSSDGPLTISIAKRDKVIGTVQAAEQKATITTASGETVSVPYEEVAAVRTAAAQAAWDREQLRLTHPPFLDFWSGSIGLNLANANGNAKTTTFGTGASAERITGKDKLALTYSQMYSTQSTVAPYGATANRVSGGFRYDRSFTRKLFGFGTNAYDYDEFLDLDLRVSLGSGLGVHAYKSPKSYLDLGAGGGWNREAFGTGLVRNSGEVLLLEESSHQVTPVVKLFQHLSFYPNLTTTGAYRANFDGGASFRLTKVISWNVALTDRYLSNPIPGKKRNDMVLTTGIGVSFDQR